MFRWFWDRYVSTQGEKRRLMRAGWEMVRRILMLFGDPPYGIVIHGREMQLPVSHKLPIYSADWPLYDTLPTRVADYLRARDGLLLMVDVGANIGDTILACSKANNHDGFLGVEANPEFVRYLKLNTNDLGGFVLVEAFCHSGSKKEASVCIESIGGTARIVEANQGVVLPKRTLDEILTEYPRFKDFNFLKVDTDGNDFDVLKGGQKSIAARHPIILMECDVFGNVNYVEDVLQAIASLAEAGYATVIVYDNLGNYFGTFAVENCAHFLDALAHQIVSEFGYYDLLFLPERDLGFLQKEKEFFLHYVEKRGLSGTLSKALSR